uniref:Uncharacterized protein n=1 Tax=Parascaris equorum TaxID=6256 RepID=A0A914R4Z3_PAREQ
MSRNCDYHMKVVTRGKISCFQTERTHVMRRISELCRKRRQVNSLHLISCKVDPLFAAGFHML